VGQNEAEDIVMQTLVEVRFSLVLFSTAYLYRSSRLAYC